MSESRIVLPGFGTTESLLLWAVLVTSAVALAYGLALRRRVLARDPGPAAMVRVASAIQEGALAYLHRQLRAMLPVVAILTAGLYLLYRPIYADRPVLAAGVAAAFLLGCLASYGAGYVGMTSAVAGNVRVAQAARRSYRDALQVAFQAGTISGMFTVGLGLLGATVIFLLFREEAMRVLVGFGFGGSLVAAFMRVGGGIYTKAADVGADLVGKVEVGIPEDDPRNAAVIADNVGDNVGDCAGMAADVFESYEVTLVAAIILGAATLLDPAFVAWAGGPGPARDLALKLVIFPLLVRAVGVCASLAGTWLVRGRDEDAGDPMRPINRGFWAAAGLSVAGFGLVNVLYLTDPSTRAPDLRFFLATLTGIVLAVIIGWLTEVFTHPDRRPVTEIAYASRTGAATLLLTGLGTGLESTVWAIGAIAVTLLASYTIFGGSVALAAYGIALAGLGLLTTTGFILAMDTFGPIVDNANGIFEMSGVGQEERAGRIVARLDQVGNTTKALTKGFAIATAVVAAIALFRSFVDEARLFVTAGEVAGAGPRAVAVLLERVGIQVNLPLVFVGLLAGGAVPFLVSAFLIRAVGRSAFLVVEEVRRQFREIPGLLEGRARPDYSRCVDIVTRAAQRELLGPGMIAIGAPVVVGFGLGAAPLGAYLAGAILTAQLLAVFMANTGGAWDNAKKKIEDGYLGGKGTEVHRAAVIGDTVGDPLKDTAGPALNPLIKVMNLVAILIVPVVTRPLPAAVRVLVVAGAAVLVGAAVLASRRAALPVPAGPVAAQPAR
ncbi:MAG: sodium-translocating pyrophosphatase [Armatimonadota bacterium]|nr:sodium-translocating pyrophosphatase [Armatimonadota bacterium]MDR7401683.1 sodium-translocating pyrophosphatase [Armatimonadota bacterium]MDR7403745.1 sodium-translocating pyrophosphatase [Armatimonadota bacterium]MDR7436307.1 sodium-translocating pyrophosphatase [Armatimonadota bacterium]MDR7471313.1 sodium-translocating pyrophosphatase [Armatimonadota bacterium]